MPDRVDLGGGVLRQRGWMAMEGTAAKDPAQGALFLAAQAKRACPSTQDIDTACTMEWLTEKVRLPGMTSEVEGPGSVTPSPGRL